MREDDRVRPLLLVSAAAMIRDDRRVLLAQRPQGKSMAGLWELPGGKVEPGESPEAALVRELREELSVEVELDDLEAWSFASHAYEGFHLLMPVYLCRRWESEPAGREGQALAWVPSGQLMDYPAPAADIPLFRQLADRMRRDT
jgi:8-oxo-dGTP diphosphatase